MVKSFLSRREVSNLLLSLVDHVNGNNWSSAISAFLYTYSVHNLSVKYDVASSTQMDDYVAG